jgi:hypothetical protein
MVASDGDVSASLEEQPRLVPDSAERLVPDPRRSEPRVPVTGLLRRGLAEGVGGLCLTGELDGYVEFGKSDVVHTTPEFSSSAEDVEPLLGPAIAHGSPPPPAPGNHVGTPKSPRARRSGASELPPLRGRSMKEEDKGVGRVPGRQQSGTLMLDPGFPNQIDSAAANRTGSEV